MLEVKGWDNLDKAFEELEEELTRVTRGLFVEVWNGILSKTPQYYGGLVASWNWTLRPGELVDRNFMIPERQEEEAGLLPASIPKYRGHRTAIGIANFFAKGKDLQFKLGQKVYFTNGADHGEGQYGVRFEFPEAYRQYMRKENNPGRMVARTLDTVDARYSRGIQSASARRLKTLRVADVSNDP